MPEPDAEAARPLPRNIADLFGVVAGAVPGRPALSDGTTARTYGELDRRTDALARALLASGRGSPGAFVGVLARNRVEWIEALLGAMKGRLVPANLNYRYVAPELRYVLEDAAPAALIAERAFLPLVAEATGGMAAPPPVLVLEDGTPADAAVDAALPTAPRPYEEALHGADPDLPLPRRSGDDLYVLYTGGTTGMPKGVLWRQEDLYLGPLGGSRRRGGPVETAADVLERLPAEDRRQIFVVVPPLMHGTGQWTALSPLLQGGSVVLLHEARFSAPAVWRAVERARATVLVMVGDVMGRPLAEELAAAPGRYDIASLRIAITSGAPLSGTVRDELTALVPGLRILNRLGSSESGPLAEAADGGADPTTARFAGASGTAVLDDGLRPLGPGDGRTGRLAKRGIIPLGYHNDPERTAATFVTDPDGVRWVLPGDFATVLEDGSIALLGRGATTINSGGEKIYPQEVEAALKTHPDVFDAIVVGVPDERFGEAVAALVQPRSGTAPTLPELDAHCRTAVAGYKVPRRILLVDRIPLTAVGKPDPFAARAQLTGR